MKAAYGRDLDLNLLRVFVVVAETGSATAAASRLYLTQPAISAALKRLAAAVGAPLFAREGRGLALTARGVPNVRSAAAAGIGSKTYTRDGPGLPIRRPDAPAATEKPKLSNAPCGGLRNVWRTCPVVGSKR